MELDPRSGGGMKCSGSLLLALPWTLRKTPHFFVCVIGKAEQGHPGKQYGQPSHAENDPEHHTYKIHSSVAGLVLTAVRPGIRPLVHFAAFHDEINLLQ
jgi:hypothetical protein